MAKIRSIWPEMCESDDLSRVPASAERTFFRLLPHTDDDGRGKDNPKLLAAKLYPLHDDMDSDAVQSDLTELASVGLIVRYVVDGSRYYWIPKFGKYQRPKHKAASKLPDPESGTRLGSDGGYLVSVDAPEEPSCTPTDPRPTPDRTPIEPPEGIRRVTGEETDTGQHPPLTAENGSSLADTLADWLISKGNQPPESDQLADHFRWAAVALERHPDETPRKLAARIALAREFCERATGEALEPSAVKQLSQIVRTTLHLASVIRWLNEAVQRGAGLDEEYRSPRALIKYAAGVSRGERGAA